MQRTYSPSLLLLWWHHLWIISGYWQRQMFWYLVRTCTWTLQDITICIKASTYPSSHLTMQKKIVGATGWTTNNTTAHDKIKAKGRTSHESLYTFFWTYPGTSVNIAISPVQNRADHFQGSGRVPRTTTANFEGYYPTIQSLYYRSHLPPDDAWCVTNQNTKLASCCAYS